MTTPATTTTTTTPAPGTTEAPAPGAAPGATTTTPATTTPAPGTTTTPATTTPAAAAPGTTTTTTPAATTTTEAGAPGAGTTTPAGTAPETYALELPANLEGSDLAGFQTWAKELGLSNEEAQAELDLRGDALTKQSAAWLAETQADTEVGGDNFQAAQTRARSVLDRYMPAGTPHGDRLRRAFDLQGYGNFAPLVVLFSRIGKDLAEDTGLTRQGGGGGHGPATTTEAAAAKLYDHPTSQPARSS